MRLIIILLMPVFPFLSVSAIRADIPKSPSSAIRVVMDDDYPPYIFKDAEGHLKGILPDQWHLWEQKTGIHVEISAMDWAKAQQHMQAGEFDVIDTIFRNEDRRKIYDFSEPYAQIEVPVIFRSDISGIHGVIDLKGLVVAVKSGDNAIEVLRSHGVSSLLEFDNYEEIVAAARDHKVNVFTIDKPPAYYYLYKFGINDQFRATQPLYTGEFRRAVLKGNQALLQTVERGFAEISQAEYQKIERRWCGQPIPSQEFVRNLWTGSAALAIILAGLFSWVWTLRRMVSQRTTALQREIQTGIQQKELLRDSELRFRTIFDNSNEAIFIHELPSGRIVDVNQTMCTMYGYTREEALDPTVAKSGSGVPPYTRSDALKWIRKAMEGGPQLFEWHTRDKTGHLFWVEVKMRPLTIGNDKTVVAAVRDIDERKRMEEALRESENKFMRLFESAPIPMGYALETDGFLTTTWNESWFRTFGYGREEAQRRSGNEIGLWADPEDRKRFIDTIKRQNRDTVVEALLLRRDRTIRACEIYGCFIGKTGQQVLMAAYFDITDRKQAERTLRESEERFSKAFSSSPAPLTISDIETGRFIDVNEQWMKMLGHTRQDTIGHTSFELKIWQDPEIRLKMREELKRTGAFRDKNLIFINKNGETRDVLWSAEIINLAGVKVMLSLFYDFTERKKAEEEKKKLQSQLLQSQKMEAVGRLAGGLAHDYNNMLGVIIGHAELARLKMGENSQIQGHLSGVISAAKRSTELTQQLLAFARRQTITPKVLEINTAITTTLKMLRLLIGAEIELIWLPGMDTYHVNIDPIKLDQLLINLCVNARDAITGVGKITIETQRVLFDEGSCLLRPSLTPGDYIVIIVSDDGAGMDEDTLTKIFEPFFTTKGIGKGTGMGLATVYGIIKQNKGLINVYSEPGRGTTFKIYLPSCGGSTREEREDTGTVPASRGETVLIVEDEPVLLEVTSTMLRDLGYKIFAAGTPTEAIRLSREHAGAIDLLMTDVVMPEMNGRELEQHILKNNPQIRRLFTSGYTANVITHNGVLDADVQFIQKPFTIKDIAAKIRKVLDRDRV